MMWQNQNQFFCYYWALASATLCLTGPTFTEKVIKMVFRENPPKDCGA